MVPVRLDPAIEEAVLRAARDRPGTPFNVNHADADGRDLALALCELLLRAGWSQLSAVGPAPGFARRGVIVWSPPAETRLATALALALRQALATEVVERSDGGPIALTVGVATWASARGLRQES